MLMLGWQRVHVFKVPDMPPQARSTRETSGAPTLTPGEQFDRWWAGVLESAEPMDARRAFMAGYGYAVEAAVPFAPGPGLQP